MKRFKEWRYKCDFCGKNGYSGGHMGKHEKGCTANPNRVCRIHKYADLRIDNPGPLPVVELIAILQANREAEDRGVNALRDAAEDCPCCMLAAIRQSGACKGDVDEDGYTPPLIGTELFDFKKEIALLWERVHENEEA